MSGSPFPPLPSPKYELEKFLLSVENLPIHDFRNSQKLWNRRPRPETLLHAPLCPSHTDLAVERDPFTGKLLAYHEVSVEGAGLTSKNSTSLLRAPGPPNQSIKGDPTNFPFWPGGLPEPEVVQQLADGGWKEDNFDEPDLETVPPGFREGMKFDGDQAVTVAKISIQDLLSGYTPVEWSQLNQKENKDVSHSPEEEVDLSKTDTGDTIDKLVKIEEEVEDDKEKTNIMALSMSSANKWAVKVDLMEDVESFYEKIPKMAHKWSFELDPFQKQAILRLESHENVFVAAHTSAGKTVVAEYAIALSLSHMTRTIYTSPIKALSNQKFHEFRGTFGKDSVGLITGDVQIKQEAPCLIMTTEILRSMLYTGSDVIRDVEWVIFDEVHYINDTERGVVWEEVMIMLPEHINLILLSATVPNAMQFADWVGRTKKKKIYVISTFKRPVPLQHFLYTGNSKQTSDQLFMIVDHNRKFISQGYHSALEAKKEREKQGLAKYGPKFKQMSSIKQDKNVWLSLIHMLSKKDKLPVVAFTLSRTRCIENADALTSLDLTSSQEKYTIDGFFKMHISTLKGSDQKLPQVRWMRSLLNRGVAVHHSGILPIIKELVELLFQKGCVKLLFATETFAMGVNMPARTVVFDSTRKHDGNKMRDLHAGEYVQMAGRAGRRGLDDHGTVILLCKADIPESSDLHKMILGTPTTLESQFRLTYSMLLNIMRVDSLRVEDMMKRSFAEQDSMRQAGHREQQMKDLKENLRAMEKLDCPICDADIDQYFASCTSIANTKREMQALLLGHANAQKALYSGRVVVVFTPRYHHSLALLLRRNPKRKHDHSYTVLMLCNVEDDSEEVSASLVAVDTDRNVMPYYPLGQMFVPDGVGSHAVVEISGEIIDRVTSIELQVNSDRIIGDYQQRQIPRFRDKAPVADTIRATEQLRMLSSGPPVSLLDPVRDFRLNDLQFVSLRDECQRVEETMIHFSCTECPQFVQHFEHTRKRAKLQEQLTSLRFMLSEESLQLLPEYHQKLQVLKNLRYLDHKKTVRLKGRVACEIHTHELLVTELLIHNTLDGYEPAEIAALLSPFVFQQSKCMEPKLNKRLKEGREKILSIAQEVSDMEKEMGLESTILDGEGSLKFGLMEVVYKWANGMEFVQVMDLTDVLEGVIVKCIQRLDELCRDVCKAARVVGAPELAGKMKETSTLIRRDIVFAASLYVTS